MDGIYEFLRSFWVLWLMAIFLGIVAWAYWPKHKHEMEEHGRIPFKDEDGGS